MQTNDEAPERSLALRELAVTLKPAVKHPTWQAAPMFRRVWAVAAASAQTYGGEWMRCDQLQQVSIPLLGIHGCDWFPHLRECERRGIIELHEGPAGRHHFRVLMAGLPSRFRHTRQKGGGLPPNAMSIMRPGPFGNPFEIKDGAKPKDRYEAVLAYLSVLRGDHAIKLRNPKIVEPKAAQMNRLRTAVQDKLLVLLCVEHLSCMCKAGETCHVDSMIIYLRDRVFGESEWT